MSGPRHPTSGPAFSRRQALQLGAAASAFAISPWVARAEGRGPEARVGFAPPVDDERVRLRSAERPVGPRVSSASMRLALEGLTGVEESALDDACLELALDDARTIWMPALHFRRHPVVCVSAGTALSLPAGRGASFRWSWRAAGVSRMTTFELGPMGRPLVEGRYLLAASDAKVAWERLYVQGRGVVDAHGRPVPLPLAWVRVSRVEERAGFA